MNKIEREFKIGKNVDKNVWMGSPTSCKDKVNLVAEVSEKLDQDNQVLLKRN